MLSMDNPVFSETSPDIKEEFKGDFYLNDKALVRDTTVNIDSIELKQNTRGDKTQQDLICTDIKLELSPSNVTDHNTIMNTDTKQKLSWSHPNLYNITIDDNIQVKNYVACDIKDKFNNKLLYCNNCNEYYEDYCTKCGMLISILNGSGLNYTERKEIPTGVLEIKESLIGGTGVFALKTIPKSVKFGPFKGFSPTESSWRLKEGKFVVSNDKLESLNWMQYINCARSVSDQNLHAFQYEDNLYYSSICEIQKGEELLVYFGEENEENLNNSIEMYFIPHTETDVKNVFACTYCCLGFRLKVHLVEHKTICLNGTVGNFEELAQCPFCKIYLEMHEYLEYHKIYCCKGNAKLCVLPALDDRTLEEKTLPPVTNKRKKLKPKQCKYIGDPKNHTNDHCEAQLFRCGICYKRFKKKESFMLHLENAHIAFKHKHYICDYLKVNINNTDERTLKLHHKGRQFKCLKCMFQTNSKYYLNSHMKTKHLKEYNYKCMKCEYKTNSKSNLNLHVKSRHLKEYDYNCTECKFKTNMKKDFKIHTKTKHLKEYDYNCTACEYKTNTKFSFETHIKTKHLKEYDYNCMECEYKTNDKFHLETHIKSKHLKEYDHNCMECEYQTNSKKDIKIHIKTKHLKEYDYNCMDCDYKTNTKSNLETHIKNKHLKEYDYNCMECEYKTNRKSNLQMHIKTKHFKENDFNCKECEYKTNMKSNLETHIKTKHLKEYDYNCIECEYKTNNKFNLETHIKTKHLEEYDYNCIECEYKTNDKRNLNRHIKNKHLAENDYTCRECEYKTNMKLNLETHIKTKHLKEYDHNCMKCEYKTNIKSNLETHIKNKHFKEYVYNCKECEYKTNNKLYLKGHIKTKHFKEREFNCTVYTR